MISRRKLLTAGAGLFGATLVGGTAAAAADEEKVDIETVLTLAVPQWGSTVSQNGNVRDFKTFASLRAELLVPVGCRSYTVELRLSRTDGGGNFATTMQIGGNCQGDRGEVVPIWTGNIDTHLPEANQVSSWKVSITAKVTNKDGTFRIPAAPNAQTFETKAPG